MKREHGFLQASFESLGCECTVTRCDREGERTFYHLKHNGAEIVFRVDVADPPAWDLLGVSRLTVTFNGGASLGYRCGNRWMLGDMPQDDTIGRSMQASTQKIARKIVHRVFGLK